MIFFYHLLSVNFLNILGAALNMIGTYLVWKNPIPIFPLTGRRRQECEFLKIFSVAIGL